MLVYKNMLFTASFLLIGFVSLSFSFKFKIEDIPPHIHGKFAYVTWTKEKGYDVKIFAVNLADSPSPGSINWVARARYQNMINKTGWAFLEVDSSESWPDEMQAHAAGLAEGYLTKDLIFYFYQNVIEHYCDGKVLACKYLTKFVNQTFDWFSKTTDKYKKTDPYWYQESLILEQFYGMIEGYRKATHGTEMAKLTDMDFTFMNILGDLDDLSEALNPNPKKGKLKMRDGHCSALIKLIGKRDIFASHVTWWRYNTMLRMTKRYNLPFKVLGKKGSVTVPNRSITFSSYPGMLFSQDDFYITENLIVMETTIVNYNTDLWKYIKPSDFMFSCDRAMIANRLAISGQHWTNLFSRYNSGTYNNQWMVLDMTTFEPEREIPDGTLFVLETMPGKVVSKDLTSVLREQGYWASYNTPYFQEIYEMSGSKNMSEKYGDFFTYENAPRGKIFARDHSKVTDIDTMMALMRYNNYKNDPLSRCNCTPPYSAVNAISSRGDLNPSDGKYPFKNLGHRQSGATDMKLANLDLFLLGRFIGISGPTFNDDIPPFKWSETTPDIAKDPHYAMPDKYEFDPVIHQWKWFD